MGWCEENGKWPQRFGPNSYGFFGLSASTKATGSYSEIASRLWVEAYGKLTGPSCHFPSAWDAIRAVDAAAMKLGMHGTRCGLVDLPSRTLGYQTCFKPVPVVRLRPQVLMAGAGL